jgi:hypothetical protein
VVGQNLTEEMKLREKASDIYKVYSERQGLFTQDDIDYLRPFEQSMAYSPALQARIEESIQFIKQQREQEQERTRKRLRNLYGLLMLAIAALVIAVVFYFNANEATENAQKSEKSAIEAKETANATLEKFKLEQAAKQKAQAEKDKNEFISLESRANIILAANACPKKITHIMDSIAAINPDSLNMKRSIRAIDSIAAVKGNCK